MVCLKGNIMTPIVESLFYVSYPPEKCQMNAEVDQYGRTLTNGPEQAGVSWFLVEWTSIENNWRTKTMVQIIIAIVRS